MVAQETTKNPEPGTPNPEPKKNMKKQHFNMIEVALAIAVIAIGMVSIMGLFPIGLSANKDAMAKSYAAESADEFLHFLERYLRQDWANRYADIPETAPSATDFSPTYAANQTIYQEDTPVDGRYKAIRFVDTDDDQTYTEGTDILDFEAIITVSREQIDIDGSSLPYDYGLKLVMEISWPARLPYANRSNDEYVLELFNR